MPGNVESEPRFGFGANWRGFIETLDDDRIQAAEQSLMGMLGVQRLDGLRFLDVGSGSGLFSLAARRLGATVFSFDYDPESVQSTRAVKERYAPGDQGWSIEEGSVLDIDYLHGLGRYDIVYSWGVLHHTGGMWQAMDNITANVAAGGYLFIALYNDQGPISKAWRQVKRLYVSGPIGRMVVVPTFFSIFVLYGLGQDLLRGRNPIRRYREQRRDRGMSVFHDWIDWFGGYPYEVARPSEVIAFYSTRGFTPHRVKTKTSLGCNEFVFRCSIGTFRSSETRPTQR